MDPKEAERLLKLITDSIAQGKDFVLEQAPDVVQQLIVYKRIEYTFYTVLLMLIIGVVTYVSIKGFNACMSKTDTESLLMLLMFAGFTYLITILILCGLVPRLIIVYVAPKVFLLEYLASLIK